jgi:hypothetical protein
MQTKTVLRFICFAGMIDAFQAKAAARRDGKLRCVLVELKDPQSLTNAKPADGGEPVETQHFDVVISHMTLHHIEDIAGARVRVFALTTAAMVPS